MAGRDFSAELFPESAPQGKDFSSELFPESVQPQRGFFNQAARNVAGGGLVGAGAIGSTLMQILPTALGGDTAAENIERRKRLEENAQMLLGSDTDSTGYSIGKFGAEALGTAGTGGLLAKGAALIPAVAKYAPTFINALKGAEAPIKARIAAGATSGYAGSALTNLDDGTVGGIIGGSLPIAGAATRKLGEAAMGAIRPLYGSGQDVIIKKALLDVAENPQALTNVADFKGVIPGSIPTSVMSSGDTGLAGLSRTMQSINPSYAIELSNRISQQNAARTNFLENFAGNKGKIALAEADRKKITDPLRESILNNIDAVDANKVIGNIDDLLKNPNNAGKLSQQALKEFKDDISKYTENGKINAKALYAIRKDINDILDGRLQGERANLRYASSQLRKVKDYIDNAIDLASKKVDQSTSTDVGFYSGGKLSTKINPEMQPITTWKDYLNTYTELSKPINQMETMSDVLKKIQTGSVDKFGNLIISAPKLNTILKNDSKDLQKTLNAEQFNALRQLSADLNASQLATTSGKSVGSDTAQKLASQNILTSALGSKLGGSTATKSLLQGALNIGYAVPNRLIMEKMGNALLNPEEMARIAKTKEGSKFLKMLSSGSSDLLRLTAPQIGSSIINQND